MKTFAVRRTFFQHDDNDFVGGSEHNRHRQGTIFVAAKKKADAIETLKSFGYNVRATECTLGMGNDMETLLEAGLIAEDRLIIASSSGRVLVASIRFDENGDRVVETLGKLQFDLRDHGQRFIPKA